MFFIGRLCDLKKTTEPVLATWIVTHFGLCEGSLDLFHERMEITFFLDSVGFNRT